MPKQTQWDTDTCVERLLEALDAQKRQLAEISKHSRANAAVRECCHQLYEALEALQEAIADDARCAIFLARSNRLPDFSTDDSQYGDVPF